MPKKKQRPQTRHLIPAQKGEVRNPDGRIPDSPLGSKKRRVACRVNPENEKFLDALEATGLSISEIVNKGIESLYYSEILNI